MVNIKTIFFCGGGSRGYAHLGVIKYLNENNLLDKIEHFIGCSIGSLISLSCICGYTYDEFYNLVIEQDLLNPSNFTDFNLEYLLDDFGLCSGKYLINFVKKIIKDKFNNENDLTFLEFHKLTNKKFTIMGTIIEKGETVYFNYELTPNMLLIEALRISMSLPIYFTSIKKNGLNYSDGGLYLNGPFNFIEPSDDLYLIMLNNIELDTCKINSLESFLFSLLSSFYKKSKEINNQFLKKYNYLLLPIKSCPVININLNTEYKIKIINDAYNYCLNYFLNKKKIKIEKERKKLEKDKKKLEEEKKKLEEEKNKLESEKKNFSKLKEDNKKI